VSTTQKASIENEPAQESAVGPLLILERQLYNTLQLLWNIQNTQILTDGATGGRTRSLLDGLAQEVGNFVRLVRKRLRPWERRGETKLDFNGTWLLHTCTSREPREQLRSLLSAFALYERQTAQAIVGLRRSGDLESSALLVGITQDIELCLWFVEVYLESFASNASSIEVPEWSGLVSAMAEPLEKAAR
jgi:hypothetical protein